VRPGAPRRQTLLDLRGADRAAEIICGLAEKNARERLVREKETQHAKA
jgi:hypothetical protein